MSKNTAPLSDSLFDGDVFIAPKYEASSAESHFTGKSITPEALVDRAQPVQPKVVTQEDVTRAVAAEVQELNDVLDRAANLSGGTYSIAEGKEVGKRPTHAKAAGTPETSEERAARMSDLRRQSSNTKASADRDPSSKSTEPSKASRLYD